MLHQGNEIDDCDCVMTTIQLIPTGIVNLDRIEYRVPDAHSGIEITRAVGRLCSGDTVFPVPGCIPTADLVLRHSDGVPHYVCVRF